MALIHILNLSFNRISTFKHGAFDKLCFLTQLTLDNNHLSCLHVQLFDGLSALTYLSLKRNILTFLPCGIFDHLIFLEYLDLSYNPIIELSPRIFSKLKLIENFNIGYEPMVVYKNFNRKVDSNCGVPTNTGLNEILFNNWENHPPIIKLLLLSESLNIFPRELTIFIQSLYLLATWQYKKNNRWNRFLKFNKNRRHYGEMYVSDAELRNV